MNVRSMVITGIKGISSFSVGAVLKEAANNLVPEKIDEEKIDKIVRIVGISVVVGVTGAVVTLQWNYALDNFFDHYWPVEQSEAEEE